MPLLRRRKDTGLVAENPEAVEDTIQIRNLAVQNISGITQRNAPRLKLPQYFPVGEQMRGSSVVTRGLSAELVMNVGSSLNAEPGAAASNNRTVPSSRQ
jgi:hypothetical protein